MRSFLIIVAFALTCLPAHAQRFIKVFDNIAAMVAANPFDTHTNVYVVGYFTANDGGEGQFLFVRSETATADDGIYFAGTHPQAATGRWVRQLKAGEPITPQMFGAKADGSTDDTARVQKALNASTGRELLFPYGTHYINGTLIPSSNTRIRGTGAQLVQHHTNAALFKIDSTSSSNITWDGLWLRGTGDYVEEIYRQEVGIYVTNVAPTSVNLVIKNCRIDNFAIGVFMWGADGVEIAHNRVTGTGTATYTQNFNFGFYLPVSVLHLNIHDNEVSNVGTGMDGAFTGNQQIVSHNFWHDITGQHAIYATDAIGGLISGNIISNVPMVGIKFQLATGGRNGYASAIKDNILINVGEQGVLFLNADPAANGFIWTNVTISGNLIHGTNAASLAPDSATNAESIYVKNVSGAIINNNQMFNRYRGIGIYQSSEVIVDNNLVHQIYGWGFYAAHNTNLTVRNTAMSGINHTFAMRIGGDEGPVTVDGLTVDNSPGTTYALDTDTDVTGVGLRIKGVVSTLPVRLQALTTITEWDQNQVGTITGLPAVTFIGRVGRVNTGSTPAGGVLGDLTWARAPSLFSGWINNGATWLPFGLINDPTLMAWDATNYSMAIGRSTLGYSYPLAIEHDTNDFVSVFVKNASTAAAGGSGLSLFSGNSSGLIGAYPVASPYGNRVAIIANSDATGIALVTQQAGQTIRLFDPDMTSVLLRTDSSGDLRSTTLGPNLLFDGVTLSLTGVSTSDNWVDEGTTNSTLAGIAKPWKVQATNSVEVGTAGEAGVIEMSSTNGTYTLAMSLLANGTLTITNNGVLVDTLALSSLYGGAGTKVKHDDGTYKAVIFPPGSTVTNVNINPTDLFLPYRSNSTTFADSLLKQANTQTIELHTATQAPTFTLTTDSTAPGAGYVNSYLRDANGPAEVGVMSFTKAGTWGGAAGIRDGAIGFNTLHDNASYNRFTIDGDTGVFTFFDNIGGSTVDTIANSSGYAGGGTKYKVDNGTYIVPTNYVTVALSNPNTAVTTGNTNFWVAPAAVTIKTVTAHLFVPSSSGSVTLELKKNGTTVLSAPVSLTSGTTNATASLSVTAVSANDRLAGEITAAGTTAYGAQLKIGYTTP